MLQEIVCWLQVVVVEVLWGSGSVALMPFYFLGRGLSSS